MLKRTVAAETAETECPACGVGIKATVSARRRKVQCPKCREIVVIEGNAPEPTLPPIAPAPVVAAFVEKPEPAVAEMRGRIQSLEARVEALEAALRDAMEAVRASAANAPQRRLIWLSSEAGRPPAFSPEQGDALFHNLGSVRSQAITIRTPIGDDTARAHADWFKSVFERAGWTVLGPEEVHPRASMVGLSLAVPELPVQKDAAATYLALKAAGFEAVPVLDSTPRSEAGPRTAFALMLPPVKAA